MARDRARLILHAGVPALAVAVLVVYPVATIVARSFDAANLADTVMAASFHLTLRQTVCQALASTAVAFAIGLPMAAVLARRQVRAYRALAVLVTIPFVMPTVVVASAYVTLFRALRLDGATVDLTEGIDGIILAHGFFNVAVVVRIVGARWELIDRTLLESALTLGASPVRGFFAVTFPALRRAMATAAVLVFLFCVTSYGVVRVLGGPRTSSIETEIYRYAVLRADLTTATSLALLQLALVALVLLVSRTWGAEPRNRSTRRAGGAGLDLSRRKPRWTGAVLAVGVGYLAAPLLALMVRAVIDDGVVTVVHLASLTESSTRLGVSPLATLVNSIQVAIVATVLAVSVGCCAAAAVARGGRTGRAVALLCALPLAVSAVTLGLGMLVAFDEPIDIRSSWIAVPLAHAALGVPLVAGAVAPTLSAVRDELKEAAAVLGAAPRRVATSVVAPIVARSAAVGASFAFAVSLGEFGASSLLARRDDQLTAPLAVERLLSRPGANAEAQAAALSVAIMAVIAAVVLVADRLAAPRGSRARRR